MSGYYALRKDDVNWLTGAVRIDWQLAEDGQRVAPKYGSRRTVIATPDVLAVLRAHVEDYPPLLSDGTLFYRAARKGLDAGPMTRYYGDRFGVYADRLAEVDPTFPLGVRSHWLRHHFASLLIHEGLDVVRVSKMMGHKSVKMTLDRYSGLFAGTEEDARAAVEAAWERAGRWATAEPDPATATWVDRRRKGAGGRWEAAKSNVRRLREAE